MNGTHTKHRMWWWGLLLVACAGIVTFAMQRRSDKRKTPQSASAKVIGSVAVTTATARKGDIGVYLDAIGTVTPVFTASITPQANGIVTAVNYKEGQMVQKGDALVEIDPRPYQAQLAQAQGTLEHD